MASSSTYANFQNPFGLVKRMVMSRDKAALSALANAALRVGLTPVDRLLASRERTLLDNKGSISQPIVLIVGGSRSGTTLLYQVLAAALDVAYFSNASSLFPSAPIIANRRAATSGPRPEYGNYYGQTAGFRGANDGFHVWNRWLGDDRYTVPPTLGSGAIDEMRRFFAAWTAAFPKPFVNKNNRNSLAVPLLADAMPEAKFVAISRDPVQVARSLILAREVVHGDKNRSWGVGASNSPAKPGDSLAYVDDVVDQVWRADSELRRALSALDPARWTSTTYEALCSDPSAVVKTVASLTPARIVTTDIAPFNVSVGAKVEPAEERRIKERIGDLYS